MKGDTAVSAIGPLQSATYPYNTVALVKLPPPWELGNASAVQVGPFAYATAAHAVVNPANNRPFPGITVKPAFHVPSLASPAIRADAFVDPAYTYAANQVRGHDVSMLHAATPRSLQAYAHIFRIQSAFDDGSGTPGCAPSSQTSDPFWRDAASSWFNPSGPYGANGCFKDGPFREIVHYPNSVNGGSNNNTSDPHPYLTVGVGLWGSSYSNHRWNYELVRGIATDGVPVIGLRNAYVSPGSSGAPLFARPFGGAPVDTVLLGVVTAQAGIDGYATGAVDATANLIWTDKDWKPYSGITFSSPTEGASYDSAAVPDLIASAGAQTSQLRWESDIDGYLGTGGTVHVAGRLSPGAHTITASIGSSGSSTASGKAMTPSSTALKTLHITVTGSLPPPSFSISPATVYVPQFRSSGSFSYEWHAPGYTSLDIQSSANGGPWQPTPALNIPAAGNTGDTIGVGTTYKFRFLPHGNVSTVLGSLTVSGVVAPPPVFAANPVHLVTNGASANTVVSWSALGYEAIDWCGNTNSLGWQCGNLVTSASGTTTLPVPVGTTYHWRFYPHGSPNQGGTFQLLGELIVDCVSNSPPAFAANPAHIIVPAGGTEGSTIITWSAPNLAGLDWCGKVNNGAWIWGGLSTQPVGSTKVMVPLGTTYGYRFYPPGGATSCSASTKLGELSVYATH
ncbi:MAG: hypothetical protein K8F35_07235 [Dokdonella sp.]|uniref:hypothetical protein n=1 Tax=Dokdonella sp. TaxID=2291710 RepID=UPI0025C00EE6|nr:hypothetical protein [Dokdonella sp.]MBZ0222806.1 hypothetical protein [Dokdonella sp.]